MRVNYNVKITMRDKLCLSAAVFLPSEPGSVPCLLRRTCYTKWAAPILKQAAYWTSNGFAFVVQDVRGRGDSDGEFYPLVSERLDGIDTLDWLVTQPWSDGRVVMYGGSYSGWTQLYIAGDNHPALIAVAPMTTPPDPDRGFPVGHGIISPTAAAWLATLDGKTNQDISGCDVQGAFSTLPIIDFDKHVGRHLDAWRDWIDNPPGTAYWREQSYQQALLESHIPMLHISGWYDDCLNGATENFVAMTASNRKPSQRANQHLIIGPWGHDTIGKRKTGEFDYGPDAEIDIVDIQRQWFNAHLGRSRDNVPRVNLFVMGRNEWVEESEWPIARTNYIPYYLHSEGNANSRLGDGMLSASPPGAEPPDKFCYDPGNPVPFATDFDWKQVGGPDNFADLELRTDILVYTTRPFTNPIVICGPLLVRLFASSTALDTDWTAKLLDVYPDGRAIRLNDGAIRARFRDGPAEKLLVPTNTIEEYLIDCWSTCIELPAGHQLRLEIASSALGKFDLNLNGGGPIGRESVPVVAEQTVYHDQKRQSHILLPVLDGQFRKRFSLAQGF